MYSLRKPSMGERKLNRIRIQKKGSDGREVLINPNLNKETRVAYQSKEKTTVKEEKNFLTSQK